MRKMMLAASPMLGKEPDVPEDVPTSSRWYKLNAPICK